MARDIHEQLTKYLTDAHSIEVQAIAQLKDAPDLAGDPGFAGALRLGVRTFEIDIGVSRDGVPVVHHDPYLNPDITRGPDGAWLETRGPLLRELTERTTWLWGLRLRSPRAHSI